MAAKTFLSWLGIAVLVLLSGRAASGQSVPAANARYSWVNAMGGASGNVPDTSFDADGNCYAICHFNSSNAVVAGVIMTNAGAGYDSFLVKYNSAGQSQWVRPMSGNASDFGLSVVAAASNLVYVVGSFYSDVFTMGSLSLTNTTSTNSSDVFAAKFDSNGNLLWLKQGTGDGIDTSYTAALDSAGNLLVGGSFNSSSISFGAISLLNAAPTKPDTFLVKYDPAGNVLWAKRGGGTQGDTIYRLAVDSTDSCYVTGFIQGSPTFGNIKLTSAGGFDAYAAKYDSSGNVLWATSLGGSGVEQGFGLALDSSNNCYVTGYFTSANSVFGSQTIHSAGTNDIFLAKLSPNGTVLWARSAGGTGNDRGFTVAVDSQGSPYVGGFFSGTANFGGISLNSSGNEDLCVIKYDANGNVQWVVPATGLSKDAASQLNFDGRGHLYISGQCSTNTAFGALTLTNALDSAMFVARLDFLPPFLNISLSNSRPILSWSTNVLTPVLAQSATNLSDPANWHDLTNVPVISGGFNVVTNLSPANPVFYRLRNAY
jgi:hypothetical protein